MVEQEVSSYRYVKLPEEPCLLHAIPMYVPLDNHLNSLLKFVPAI